LISLKLTYNTDFADFQSLSAEPSPAPLYASTTSASVSQPSTVPSFHPFAGRPYTKWYRVWERVELRDFQQEAIILPFVLALLLAHFWGTRSNKRKAHKWMKTIAPVLQAEFAQVGFTPPEGEAGNSELIKPEDALKHVAPNEYTSFATGRQNIAFADFRLTLLKWYNPFLTLAEYALNFAFDSLPAPAEKTEITLYPFDGSEKELVPSSIGPKSSVSASSYDGFVWAVVHKNKIKSLRDERYDLSLTSTKDHPKLPGYLTVMTESAEISDAILSPELVKAIEEAGNDLETIIVTDQPIDAPKSYVIFIYTRRLFFSFSTNTFSLGLMDSKPANACTSLSPRPPAHPRSFSPILLGSLIACLRRATSVPRSSVV